MLCTLFSIICFFLLLLLLLLPLSDLKGFQLLPRRFSCLWTHPLCSCLPLSITAVSFIFFFFILYMSYSYLFFDLICDCSVCMWWFNLCICYEVCELDGEENTMIRETNVFLFYFHGCCCEGCLETVFLELALIYYSSESVYREHFIFFFLWRKYFPFSFSLVEWACTRKIFCWKLQSFLYDFRWMLSFDCGTSYCV